MGHESVWKNFSKRPSWNLRQLCMHCEKKRKNTIARPFIREDDVCSVGVAWLCTGRSQCLYDEWIPCQPKEWSINGMVWYGMKQVTWHFVGLNKMLRHNSVENTIQYKNAIIAPWRIRWGFRRFEQDRQQLKQHAQEHCLCDEWTYTDTYIHTYIHTYLLWSVWCACHLLAPKRIKLNECTV